MRFLPRFKLARFSGALLLPLSVGLVATLPAHAQDVAAPVKITFITIDVPAAAVTEINGINTAGDMVGFYGENTSGPDSGFLYSNGTFTYFDYPGESVTVAGGINDSGLIVGLATQNAEQRSTVVGFLYDGTTFTTLKDGNNAVTNAYGINNAGTVVGSSGPDLGAWEGFEERNGQYKTVNLPGGCPYADAEGINNLGEIAAVTFCGIYDYGYAVKKGKLQGIDFPGAQETVAVGINDSGFIVGWYNPASSYNYAFVFGNGKYISFGYPGALGTFALGINKSGQIVGTYTFDYQSYQGFVTSPIASADFDTPGCCRVATVETR